MRTVTGAKLEINTTELSERLMSHRLYDELRDEESLRIFMRSHVFCVWDFQSLLKGQRSLGDLTGVTTRIKAPIQYIVTRVLKPKFIVETGVGIGISSMFFLEALKENECGTLYSIDLPRTSYKRSFAQARA